MRSSINIFIVAILVAGCQRNEVIKEPASFTLSVPSHFPKPPDDADNPLTAEGIELGQHLFYDKTLSGNNFISCASCHRPEKSFTDGVALSDFGVSGTVLHRHAPSLINLIWADKGLFWDGGSTNLESQAFGPLTAHDEMSQNLFELEAELKANPYYVREFNLAFGDTIKSAYVVKALAQFQRTMISSESKYDLYMNKKASLTAEELKGLRIVEQKCSPCHTKPLFTDYDFHNNGIDNEFTNDDFERLAQGRSRITHKIEDLGKFKTPTLRNIMLTSPYMHDGRFSNIENVLEHYNSGVKPSNTLDVKLKSGNEKPGIQLSSQEKKSIVAFLHALTDTAFIANRKLSDPLK